MTAELLSVELLEELAERWRVRRDPIQERLADGLSPAAMDALAASLPFSLSTEARTWWGWHDGAEGPNRGWELPVCLPFMSLRQAIEEHERVRGLHVRLSDESHRRDPSRYPSPDAYWPVTWLPITIFGHGSVIVCDCGVEVGAPSPIYTVSFEEAVPYPPPGAASFGDLVSMWIEAIDVGFNVYHPEYERWFLADEPPEHIAWRRFPS